MLADMFRLGLVLDIVSTLYSALSYEFEFPNLHNIQSIPIQYIYTRISKYIYLKYIQAFIYIDIN